MKKILTRTGQILAGTLAVPIILLGMVSTLSIANATENKPSVCHPVNGNGELGNGWNLISPDKASSHIDESLYPDGEYWQHESKDGRHDQYAVDETCPTDQPYVPTTCPDGQTEVGKEENGDAICRNNPTGCPYGDSIPVDSPKCVAPEDEVENTTPTPVETQETEVFYGK